MKKLFLLVVSGVLSLAASAQSGAPVSTAAPKQANPVVYPVSASYLTRMSEVSPFYTEHHSRDTRRKTPGVATYNDWYDLWDQNVPTGGGPSSAYYIPIFPDSTLFDDYKGSSNNVGFHGIGMSFDPTDSGYSYNALVSTVGHPLPPTGQPYTIDSFYVPIQYLRNNPSSGVVDSIVIEVVVTNIPPLVGDSGAYNLQYNVRPLTPAFAAISYDTMPRFGSVHYNNGQTAPYNVAPYINDCYFDSIFTRKYRYVIPLTNAAPDTDATGLVYLDYAAHKYPLHLSPAITISNTNTHVVSFISFKSGVTYPLGTHTSVANLIHLFAGEPLSGSYFRQSSSNNSLSPVYPGSYQAGLFVTNLARYNNAGYAFDYHNVLFPGFNFTYPGLSVTFDQWHINWTCTTPTVTAVLGSSTVCVSASTGLSDVTGGGTWSASNANATISGTGLVSGVTAGVDTITYTVSNSCGSVTATKTVTVNPLPVAGPVTGPAIVCVGATITLTDATPGGVWSSGSTTIATVAGGVVTGTGVGSTPIKYTVSNSCGSAVGAEIVAVYAAPAPGTITGTPSVCIGSTISLSDAASGGAWTAANGNATVSVGNVTGVVAGTDVISYTVTTPCAAASAITTVTVNPLPVPTLNQTGNVLSTTSYVSYQWNLTGTGPISGATNSSYTVLLLGGYSVTVTDANGCSGTSAVTIVDPSILGMQNLNSFGNDVRIYPNPAQSVVNIESSVKVNIQLTTMDGRLIMDKKDANSINISNLPDGNYILNVYDADTHLKLKTDRLVKLAN